VIDPTIVQKYERQRVPRYTSYPTAPHFHAGVGEAAYRAWLAGLAGDTKLSLYLHVPFCRSLCWYCGCHTKIPGHDEPILRYLDALWREIGLVAEALPGRMAVSHIHWGGGTPTIVAPKAFASLMEMLCRRFAVAADAEIAVEIDPRRLSVDMIAALAAAGVNRASLGVQSFAPVVQRAVNRVQSFAETRAACDGLRRAGIAAVNFDLLYGLPHQTAGSCRDTVRQALTLAPDRLSVFGYAHMPALKPHQKRIDEAALPDGSERLRQFEAISADLVAAGYVAIGLDHFARAGDPLVACLDQGALRRNFQGYTTDQSAVLLGFGASAIGALPNGYVQNAAQLGAYRDAVAGGHLPTARGICLDDDDRLRRDIIEQLMCGFSVDLAATAARYPSDASGFTNEFAALHALADDGLVRIAGSRIEIPPESRPLVRCIAAVFDLYLDPAASRHAIAV